MNNELPLITIVTVTKNRPNLLKRAIETVKQQTYSNIKHLIIIDECPETLEMLESNYKNDPKIEYVYMNRVKGDKKWAKCISKIKNICYS